MASCDQDPFEHVYNKDVSLLTAKADPMSTQPINPDALPAGLGVERCWPFDWLLANMNDLASTRMKNIAYRLFLTLVLLFLIPFPVHTTVVVAAAERSEMGRILAATVAERVAGRGTQDIAHL